MNIIIKEDKVKLTKKHITKDVLEHFKDVIYRLRRVSYNRHNDASDIMLVTLEGYLASQYIHNESFNFYALRKNQKDIKIGQYTAQFKNIVSAAQKDTKKYFHPNILQFNFFNEQKYIVKSNGNEIDNSINMMRQNIELLLGFKIMLSQLTYIFDENSKTDDLVLYEVMKALNWINNQIYENKELYIKMTLLNGDVKKIDELRPMIADELGTSIRYIKDLSTTENISYSQEKKLTQELTLKKLTPISEDSYKYEL